MKINTVMCGHIRCDEEAYKLSPVCTDSENPTFSFCVTADSESERSVFVENWRILVASSKEKLAEGSGDMWDSGNVGGGDTLAVKYKGKELSSKTTYYFQFTAAVLSEGAEKTVLKSPVGIFTTGLYYSSDWMCGFIGIPLEAAPKFDCEEKDKVGLPAPYLRKSFTVNKPVLSAKAYATAYGVYELYINGERDGHYVLAPEWTDYRKSIQYQYYDLTEKIKQGENVIGAIIGDGWFAGNVAGVGRHQYGDAPLGLMLNLTLTYEDGTQDIIVTDGSWLGSTGAILYTDNQTGEYYDARCEKDGWCEAGYDTTGWHNVIGVHPPRMWGNRVKASIGPQVRVMKQISPIGIAADKNGCTIVDMGQNMVGFAEVKLRGGKSCEGRKLVFRFGEMLNLDGTIYTENLRTALQTDTYVMKGGGDGETYRPHFTFHGFRYIEISGLDCTPELSDITGCVIYSACETTGSITTSNAMVNKLFQNAMWGQMGNFVGVPTDCPQRDERMGWTGDAQVFCRTACYNMDCYGFYDKYGEDILESQKPNGSVTDVVPHVTWANGADLVGNGAAAWGDVMFVMPLTVYEMYGDIEILRKYYGAMKSYFKYLLGTTVGLLRPDIGYGDWLSIDDDTPKDVIGTAYFAYDAKIMQRVAEILGEKADSEYYTTMFDKISKAWRNAYIAEDGTVKGDTQCCYLLPFKMDLLTDDESRAVTAKHLVRTIERKNFHLSTGFVGVSYLLPVLCDCGYSDIAYRLLLNDTYPSWGYSIKNGATTIWERWNSYTIEDGFGDVGMNSFNHYSLGSVSEWMYAYMGGIKPLAPGFKKIGIKPYFTNRLDFADVCYDSISGRIRSSWKRLESGKIELTVEIPADCTAKVSIGDEMHEVSSGKHIFVA